VFRWRVLAEIPAEKLPTSISETKSLQSTSPAQLYAALRNGPQWGPTVGFYMDVKELIYIHSNDSLITE
jgi:hypothetical protein